MPQWRLTKKFKAKIMTKQHLSFFLLFIVMGSSLFSQTKSKKVDISWGEEQKTSKKLTLNDLIGFDESGIYALKTKGSKYYLEHYNNKLNISNTVELDLEREKQENTFEFILQWNNRLLLFSSYPDKSTKKNHLYVQSIDKQSLSLNNDIKKISEIDFEGRRRSQSGSFNYSISNDSSKLLIYYSLPYRKNKNEEFGFHVFDKNMEQIWEKQINLPYEEGLFKIEEYTISNTGDVYVLGVAYKEKRVSKRHGQPNYNYQILSYSDKGSNFKNIDVELEGKFLTDMQIAINEKDEIICAGFYSTEGTYSIKGSFFLKVDAVNKKVKHSNFKEFDMDFLTQNLSEKAAKKVAKKKKKGKDVELYEYDLDRIVLREDGGAVLIGEQFYINVVTTTNSNGGTTTTYYYNYNDIIAINISPEGNIEWATKIPKRQVTSNDGGFYSSYTLAVVDDKLYFVFNDNGKNLFYKGGSDKLYNFTKNKESLVTLVEVDSNGNQSREALFSVRDADILMRPKVSEQVQENELILFGQRKKVQKFARLTF